VHGLAAHDAGCLDLHAALLDVGQWTPAVDGNADGVDHAAQQAVADGHRQDAVGGLDRLALADVRGLAQHHGADRLLVEVQGQAQHPGLELEQLVDRSLGEPDDGGDAVTDLLDPADLRGLDAGLEVLEVLAERRRDVGGVDGQLCHVLPQ
jgi:hypothetical protein